MRNVDSRRILFVHPPIASPAAPPGTLLLAAVRLGGGGRLVEIYDANLDWFLNHLLPPEKLEECVSIVQSRQAGAAHPGSDDGTVSRVDDIMGDPESWRKKMEGVCHSLGVLRSLRFYQPEEVLQALVHLRELLRLWSLAYHPAGIPWLSANRGRHSEGGRGFYPDPDNHPFLELCGEGLGPRIAHAGPDEVIFWVAQSAQFPAVEAMRRFCQVNRPDLRVTLMGEVAEDRDDSTLDDGTERVAIKDHESWADSRGLPLEDYLAPGFVLPLGGHSSSPSFMLGFMQVWQERWDAKGFLALDERLGLSHIARGAAENSPDKASFVVGLTCPLESIPTREEMKAAYQRGLRMIRWRRPFGDAKIAGRTLWEAADSGLWNHLLLPSDSCDSATEELIRFAAANPNIVHSWSVEVSVDWLPPTAALVPEGYGEVGRLPGHPLWQELEDPVYLLLYLRKYGARSVLRWRVGEDRGTVHTVGSQLEYHYLKPKELPAGYLEEICRMVAAGGSVGTKWVRHNLERAYLIGFVTERGVIVANSSLKRPREEHVAKVAERSGVDLSGYLERGYTSVRPEYRGLGIGTRLLEGLTSRAGDHKIFSIISADNVATQKMAQRNQTKEVARFYSESLGKEVGVWVPSWMLDD